MKYVRGSQLNATSDKGAALALEIRADHRETNIAYNLGPLQCSTGLLLMLPWKIHFIMPLKTVMGRSVWRALM